MKTPIAKRAATKKGATQDISRAPDVRRRQLLALLASGEFRSGEQLASDLRVTRSAVWKLIGKLRALGIAIEAAPRLGYRLPAPVQLYDAQSIRAAMVEPSAAALSKLDTLLAVDSTNRFLIDAPAPPAGQAHACVAEVQTSGRGRRGRSWLAPFGSGVCLSIAWQFSESPPEFSALSLAVGVAVVRALQRIGCRTAQLKWPNDILSTNRKLAGILIDMRGEASGPARVVIGIGVNLRLPNATRLALAEQQSALVTDLHELLQSKTPDRNVLVGAILNELLSTLQLFQREGFAAFAAEWRTHDALFDRPVRVLLANESVLGVARGVAPDGALLVEVNGTLRRFTSGDVSVRAHAES